MQILYIITQADGGGAQKYVLSLAKHFRGTIAAGDEAGKLFDNAKQAGLTVFPLTHLKRNIHPWHDFLAVWEIKQLIKNLQPDIVHLNSTKAGILGSFASIGLKKRKTLINYDRNLLLSKSKMIFTAHGFRFNEPLSFPAKNFYLALEKTASIYRDFIITVSDADRKSALNNKIINENKIQTIHNGIPQINFLTKEEARQKLNLPNNKFAQRYSSDEDEITSTNALKNEQKNDHSITKNSAEFIFGTIANFYKSKGIDVLIEAISRLDQPVKDKCQFVIIGEGKEKKNLELRIKNHSLEKQIILLGKINNAPKYLKAFDAFILPSRKEGFPFVILEAMQAGLPIIATDVGGNKEALDDAGIIIPPEDSTVLAKEIFRFTYDRINASKLSQKALERSKLFTEQKMLTETESIYQKLLN